jgi:hypothetical protein
LDGYGNQNRAVFYRGVKKIFILAIAPCKETYDNVKLLIEKICLQHFEKDWKLAADLKFINTFCGIGPHSSSFPCYLCTWKNNSTNGKGPPRSFSEIRECHARWVAETNRNEKRAQNYYRCIPQSGGR